MAAKKKATAKKEGQPVATAPTEQTAQVLRLPSEARHRDQLEALEQNDEDPKPSSWRLSPRAVLLYVLGGKSVEATVGGKKTKVAINKKFFGDRTVVERAIVTLASERALLLVGDPGTGKSWLSEHLAAAISGNSTLTIQGTAGTTEEQVKYSWNIARVIAEGPKPSNMIPSPTMVAMRAGGILRFEEITRCVPDVQDSLVSILSDKAIAVPELPDANRVDAKPGFNVIATANTRDQGVNELSAALKRRFNYIHIPIVRDQKTEMEIVRQRSAELMRDYDLSVPFEPTVFELLTTVFRELRNGKSSDGVSVKSPSTTLSTAEAIGVAFESALHSQFFADGKVTSAAIARNLIGSVVKEDLADANILKEYVVLVARKRASDNQTWREFHDTSLSVLK